MEWWLAIPHGMALIRFASIQRSLDWKRVAKIVAYLFFQKEIVDTRSSLISTFEIFTSLKTRGARKRIPVASTLVFKAVTPTFSNVLLHVNGASVIT